jgi:hypothetical protein
LPLRTRRATTSCCTLANATACAASTAGCAWDWQQMACHTAKCIDMADQATCAAHGNCTWDDVNQPLPCMPAANKSAVCEQYFDAATCATGSGCAWSTTFAVCYKSLYGVPCGFYASGAACPTARCVWRYAAEYAGYACHYKTPCTLPQA